MTVVNPVLFNTATIKTIKATGLDVYNANLVETLDDTEVKSIGDTAWSASGMTKLSVGGNSKYITYLGDSNKTYGYNPQTNVATTLYTAASETVRTFPAMKIKSNDKPVSVCTLRDAAFDIRSIDGSGVVAIINPWRDDSATLLALSHRNNYNSSSFCAAVFVTNGTDFYIMSAGDGGTWNKVVDGVDPTSSFTVYADFERNMVALIERLTNGNHIIRRYTSSLNPVGEDPFETISMPTAGYTGKICDPFATKPLFYGYNATNLFKIEGADAAVAVLNPAVAGITGIAVFTKYGADCEAGYIYREADGSTCRDNTGKRTASVEGVIVNDYNYIVYKISEHVVTDITDPDVEA